MISCNVHELYTYFALNYWWDICFQTLQHMVSLKNPLLWIYQKEMTKIYVANPTWLLHIQHLIKYPNYLGQNILNLFLRCFLTFFIEESWLDDLINDFMQCAWNINILWTELILQYLFTYFTVIFWLNTLIIDLIWCALTLNFTF